MGVNKTKKPKAKIWKYYNAETQPDGVKIHFKCVYCQHRYTNRHATRLGNHLISCKLCPPDVKRSIIIDKKARLNSVMKHDRKQLVKHAQSKIRWENKDYVRKHLKKHKTGQDTDNQKMYKYDELVPYVQEIQTISNVSSAEEDEEDINSYDLPVEEIKNEPNESSFVTENESDEIKPSKRKKSHIETPSPTLMKYIIDENEDSNGTKSHPIDAFLAGIGATIKKFTPYNQCLIKGRIFTAVQELELQELQMEIMSPEHITSYSSHGSNYSRTPSPTSVEENDTRITTTIFHTVE